MNDWAASGPWLMRFRKALVASFDDPALELLTSDYFHPWIFSQVAPPTLGVPYESRVQELLKQARMVDMLPDLVAAAHERRPGNRTLASIAADLGLAVTGGPRVDNPTGQPLEALIHAGAKFITMDGFTERMSRLEGQVCRIDIPNGGGTGFLVAADLVLTNHHVIRPLLDGVVQRQDVRCWFDYRRPVNAPSLRRPIRPVDLATGWNHDAWPPSAFDWTPELGDAGPDEIDCALIRLAEPVGDLPVGGDTTDAQAQPRGWIDTAAPGQALAAGNQLFLLQHPLGAPLQLTIGTVTGYNAANTRVRYTANSRAGSSGGPCFDADLGLVAVHHAHDPQVPPAWNQAVPLATLQRAWQDHHVTVG